MKTRIIGTGSYLPERVVTNKELETLVETSDEWIRERTGIAARRVAVEEGTVDMANKAADAAIADAGIDAKEIDLIIAATLSSDSIVPSLACMVQAHLKADNAVCFDVNAACSGFVYGLHIAEAMMRSGAYKTALVLGAETLSKITDWKDRSTCILFGDGAGAAVVQLDEEKGILAQDMGACGEKGMAVYLKGQSTRNFVNQKPLDENYLVMDGGAVFKFAVSTVPASIERVLEESGVPKEKVKYYILHQANYRIVEAVSRRLKEDISKIPMSMDKYGNTSSASLPIMLDEINKQGKLEKGDYVVFSGFGGGLTWATMILEW